MQEPVTLLSQVQWFSSPHDPHVLSAHGFACGFLSPDQTGQFQGHSVQQVHGVKVLPTQEGTSVHAGKRPEADGIYTLTHGETVGIKTADCLPILFATSNRRAVMAIHAGWRGLTGGILKEGLAVLKETGGDQPLAVVGPSICPYHYEVGPEVVEALVSQKTIPASALGFCLQKGAKDRWHLDLASAAVLQLLTLGVKGSNISALRSCTFEQPSLWASYRRDKLKDNGKVGRIWSWIQLP